MTDTNPATLDRVRKLLAKAEDPACTPAEAEAFTAKATDLIAKYGIDAALLAEKAPQSDRVGDLVVYLDAPYARDKGGLLSAVALALRCKVVQRHDVVDGVRRMSMHLFGHASDLDRVDLLYTSLLVQAAHALAVETVPPGQNPKAYRRSWYAGYRQAIHGRLLAAESSASSAAEQDRRDNGTGRSVALVLADRSAAVKAAMDEMYPKLRATRSRTLSGSGRGSGYAAGQRADLGGPRITRHTGNRTAIGSR